LLLGSSGGAIEDLLEARLFENIAELHERGQAQAPVGQVFAHDREARDEAGGGRPAEGRPAGELEMVGQERERRREPELEIELSPIELGQVGEKLDEEAALRLADLVEAGGERVRRGLGERGQSGAFHGSL